MLTFSFYQIRTVKYYLKGTQRNFLYICLLYFSKGLLWCGGPLLSWVHLSVFSTIHHPTFMQVITKHLGKFWQYFHCGWWHLPFIISSSFMTEWKQSNAIIFMWSLWCCPSQHIQILLFWKGRVTYRGNVICFVKTSIYIAWDKLYICRVPWLCYWTITCL